MPADFPARAATPAATPTFEVVTKRIEREGVVSIYTLPAPDLAELGRRTRVSYNGLLDYCLAHHRSAEAACRVHPDSRMYQHDRACFFQLANIVAACAESDVIKRELVAAAKRRDAEAATEAAPTGEETATEGPTE